MNTSKAKPVVPGASKIPTIKRPVPVSASTTRHEPATTIKSTKPVPTITPTSNPITPKHKTTLESKVNDAKTIQLQSTQPSNKENKENISLNSTKKSQDVKVKGYTELKKSEERLSELVQRFELEKQNHSQHILTLEQKHKEELRAKDEVIRNLQYQLEASHDRTQSAENNLNTLQEDLSALTARNKSLESLLEEVNVDVVALQRIPVVVNTDDIEHKFQEFKEAFERDYEASLKCIKQRDELLACMAHVDISAQGREWEREGEGEGEEGEGEGEPKEREASQNGICAQKSDWEGEGMEDSVHTMEVD